MLAPTAPVQISRSEADIYLGERPRVLPKPIQAVEAETASTIETIGSAPHVRWTKAGQEAQFRVAGNLHDVRYKYGPMVLFFFPAVQDVFLD
jgi:hypothetical protein